MTKRIVVQTGELTDFHVVNLFVGMVSLVEDDEADPYLLAFQRNGREVRDGG